MKKKLIILFCFVSTVFQLTAVMIHVNTARQSVIQAADQYLAQQGFPVADVPDRLMNEYYQKVDATIDSLKATATSTGRSYVDGHDVASEVRYQFGKFYENLRTIVLGRNINTRVTDAIHEAFRIQNTSVSSIPSSMRNEFQSRREAVMRRLRSTMTMDNRDYVRINEVERMVKEEMTPLIHRAKQQFNSNNQQESSDFSLWNFLFGDSSSSQQSSQSSTNYDSGRVTQTQLEAKVLDAASRHLSRNSINADRIPARSVASYSSAVSRVLSSLRERMSSYSRDYVTAAEIELMVSQRFKALIDEIKLTGKECPICRDEYRSGQVLGNLYCGHFFHRECVNSWFQHKRSCPECYQVNASIASEEVIP